MRSKTLKIIALGALPFLNTSALIVSVLPLAAGCVVRASGPEAEVEVGGPPPPPIQETVVVAPTPGMIWIGGAWVWGAGGWHWGPGRWERAPFAGARWYGPHYEFRGGRHVWVRGHWR